MKINVTEILDLNGVKYMMVVLSQNPELPKMRELLNSVLLGKEILVDEKFYRVDRVEYQSIPDDIEHQFIALKATLLPNVHLSNDNPDSYQGSD